MCWLSCGSPSFHGPKVLLAQNSRTKIRMELDGPPHTSVQLFLCPQQISTNENMVVISTNSEMDFVHKSLEETLVPGANRWWCATLCNPPHKASKHAVAVNNAIVDFVYQRIQSRSSAIITAWLEFLPIRSLFPYNHWHHPDVFLQ